MNQTKQPESKPTSLADLLFMYSKAEDLCYVDFMEGAKALVTFMAPIEIPVISSRIRLPELLGGYAASELATIIAPHSKRASPYIEQQNVIREPVVQGGSTTYEIEVAICWIMMTEVFPKLQAQWESQEMDQYGE